jgi:simple sugar transport system permease protein
VALILVGMSAALPSRFPTIDNFQSMSVQFPEIGILAIAIMLTMLTGGIDLSIIGIANLSGILAALTLTWLVPPEVTSLATAIFGVVAAIVVALAVGSLCGLLNGLLVANVGITPILATLGTMSLFTGFGIVITKGTAVFAIPEFLYIGGGVVLGVPVPLLIFAAIAMLFSVILNRTAFGFRLYLFGTNPTAARFSGISAKQILIRTYILSGVLAAVAGIIFLSRNNSAKPDYASSYVLQAILVVILGGVNPSGGFGKISGLVLAILALQFLSTGFNMLLITYSGSNFFKEFAWGAVLLLVMVIDSIPQLRARKGRPQLPRADRTQGKEVI